jgi:hypothetical protein
MQAQLLLFKKKPLNIMLLLQMSLPLLIWLSIVDGIIKA